jgi:hypothetical protein
VRRSSDSGSRAQQEALASDAACGGCWQGRLRRAAVQTAFTFGLAPLALWSSSGFDPIEPSERQRRHPLIYGWPILWRVLARRDLR